MPRSLTTRCPRPTRRRSSSRCSSRRPRTARLSSPWSTADRRSSCSNDGGRTWREAGAGLGRAVAVAISPVHPDLIAVATEERIHVSHDGGRFWSALAIELPAITALAFAPVAV